MNLKNQKGKIARMLNIGKKRVRLDPTKLSEISKAITKSDIRSLLAHNVIQIKKVRGKSGFRFKKIKAQKAKGRRKGIGSRKGKKYSRISAKRRWISRVRTQRGFIKKLKDRGRIGKKTHRDMYHKIKSNKFRNVRLIKLYLEENKLFLQNAIQEKKGEQNKL